MGILNDAYHCCLNRLKTDRLHDVYDLALGKHNGLSSIIDNIKSNSLRGVFMTIKVTALDFKYKLSN